MDTGKCARKYAIISAVCFLVMGVERCIREMIYTYKFEDYHISFWNVVYWGLMVIFAIFLFVGKKDIRLVIISFLDIVFEVLVIVSFLNIAIEVLFTDLLIHLIYMIARIALLVLLLFHCVKPFRANVKVTKYIWFIPMGLLAFARIVEWIKYDYFSDLSLSYIWHSMLLECVEIAAFLFIGLWLKNSPVEAEPVSAMQGGAYTMGNQQNGIIGEADRLKACKELLDSGLITQEEFEAKKKQILGL